ncbi:MAG: DUF4007 family protein [Candidatus Hydrogenedentota bacterium]|nr:MAG: DUF4007 family protein [Candidatus Hydrogenedentota bacterium]
MRGLGGDTLKTFARHQTFAPRYGWLTRGLEAVESDADFFHKKDVHFELGVGKNMAQAIRYWIEAFGLVERIEDSCHSKMRHNLVLTELGRFVLENDRYMELPQTLWLLHYHLVCSKQLASSWYYVFQIYNRSTFRTEDLTRLIHEWSKEESGKTVSLNSIKKDLQIISRMYAMPDTKSLKKNKGYEDLIDSVFSPLGLLQKSDFHEYVFAESHIPLPVLLYSIAYYMLQKNLNMVSLHALLNDECSAGKSFRARESQLLHAIQSPLARQVGFRFQATAGVYNVTLTKKSDAIQKLRAAMIPKSFQEKSA